MTDTPNPQGEIREAVAREMARIAERNKFLGIFAAVSGEIADAAIAAHKRALAKAGYVIVPRKVLEEIEDYFDDRADAEYLPDKAAPAGNEEMRLLVEIRAVLAKGESL